MRCGRAPPFFSSPQRTPYYFASLTCAPPSPRCSSDKKLLAQILAGGTGGGGDASGGGSGISFGAQQVVLVRDAEAKRNLPPQIKSSALVLTIAQCKGLESAVMVVPTAESSSVVPHPPIAVDDVLLYNFWRDSPAEAKHWRVLAGYLDDVSAGRRRFNAATAADDFGLEAVEASPGISTSHSAGGVVRLQDKETPEGYPWPVAPRDRRDKREPPSFDPECHRGLEAELKELYTAITRAKVRA